MFHQMKTIAKKYVTIFLMHLVQTASMRGVTATYSSLSKFDKIFFHQFTSICPPTSSEEHKNEETARGQLMTWTRQFIFSPTLLHPYPVSSNCLFKQPIDSALTTCLPSLFQSFTTLLVSQYPPTSVLNLSCRVLPL